MVARHALHKASQETLGSSELWQWRTEEVVARLVIENRVIGPSRTLVCLKTDEREEHDLSRYCYSHSGNTICNILHHYIWAIQLYLFKDTTFCVSGIVSATMCSGVGSPVYQPSSTANSSPVLPYTQKGPSFWEAYMFKPTFADMSPKLCG